MLRRATRITIAEKNKTKPKTEKKTHHEGVGKVPNEDVLVEHRDADVVHQPREQPERLRLHRDRFFDILTAGVSWGSRAAAPSPAGGGGAALRGKACLGCALRWMVRERG